MPGPTGSAPRRERVSGPIEKKPLSSLTSPDELLELIPAEKAQWIFEHKGEIRAFIDLVDGTPNGLTEEEARALIKRFTALGWPEAQAATTGVASSITRPTQPPAAAETAHPSAELVKQESLLAGGLKAIIKPIYWKDKSKIGYGIGVAAGAVSKASWFVGIGPVVEASLGASAYGLNYVYDRYAQWKIDSAESAAERARREEKYKRAFGFVRGLAAGYSAMSIVNVAGTAIAPKLVAGLYASKPFQEVAAFASQKASDIDTALRNGTGPLQNYWEKVYEPLRNFFIHSHRSINPVGHKSSVLQTAGEIVRDSGDIVRQAGTELTKLGEELSY